LKPRDDFAHILTSIEQQQLSKEEEQRNKLKVVLNHFFHNEICHLVVHQQPKKSGIGA
jgi:hypothetical protein